MNKEYFIIGTLLVTCISLWFTKFQLEQNIYTNTISQGEIEQKSDTLRHENNDLKLELLQKESYSKISSEAASMGFFPAPFVTP